MRIGNNRENNENNNNINVYSLYNQIKILNPLFDSILIVDTVEKKLLNVHEYGIEKLDILCTTKCPFSKDKCGCPCNESVSTGEKRSRFLNNKTEAYFVITVPFKMKYRNLTMVLLSKLDPQFSFGVMNESEAVEQITKISSTLVIDPLTKIFNRKFAMDNIQYKMNEAVRKKQEVCLANIDVDNFKRFNDTYGHDFGDKVLVKTAELMKKSIEPLGDAYPIRMGGDEFMIVSVGISRQRFKACMTKLCCMVEDTKLRFGNQLVGIKISIGVAEMNYDKAFTFKELYEESDKHLYMAKEAGKGCVR